jgi:hypothetical protein
LEQLTLTDYFIIIAIAVVVLWLFIGLLSFGAEGIGINGGGKYRWQINGRLE